MYNPDETTKRLSIDCPFLPLTDIHPVDQFGFLNVREVYESGTIDGNVTIRDESFNGVVDPDALLNRPLDQFEALRQMQYVRESLKAAKAKPEQVTQSGEAN